VGGKAAVLYDGEPIQAFHGFAEFSSESDTIPVLAIGMPSRKHYPHRNLCTCDFRKFGGRTFLGQFFSKGDVQETRVNTREEVWWTWSGSNRRPLPCHFPQRSVALRHTVTPVDTKRAVFMGLLPMLLPLQTYGATPSDRARHRQGFGGYDTRHDTNSLLGMFLAKTSRLPSSIVLRAELRTRQGPPEAGGRSMQSRKGNDECNRDFSPSESADTPPTLLPSLTWLSPGPKISAR